METTGQSIMKKLSGEAAAGVATGVRIAKAFEDMSKKGEDATAQEQVSSEASKEAMMKEKALRETQNKIDSKVQQNRDIKKRFEEVKTQANQGQDYMLKKELSIGGGR